MNLWQTLLHPDQEELENADRREVGRAANILQVGEFQLLQLAYREWHEEDLPEALVDRLFYDYMIYDDVPHWARHYARQVLRLDETGRLDSNNAQYHLYDSNYGKAVPNGVRRFWTAAGCLTALFVVAIAVAELVPVKTLSMFPPYLSEDELTQNTDHSPADSKVMETFDGFGRADSLHPRTGP